MEFSWFLSSIPNSELHMVSIAEPFSLVQQYKQSMIHHTHNAIQSDPDFLLIRISMLKHLPLSVSHGSKMSKISITYDESRALVTHRFEIPSDIQ